MTDKILIKPADTLAQFYALNHKVVFNKSLSANSKRALIDYINNTNKRNDCQLDWDRVFSKAEEYTIEAFCKEFKGFFGESDYGYVAKLAYGWLADEYQGISKKQNGSAYLYIVDGQELVAEEFLEKFEEPLLKHENYLSTTLSIVFELTDISYYDFIELKNGNVLAIHGSTLLPETSE